MKRYLFLLMGLMILNCNAEDLYLEDITYTWGTGCQYYKVYSETETGMLNPGIDYYTVLHGKILNARWEIEKTEYTYVDIPIYKDECLSVSDNKTGFKEICTPGEITGYDTRIIPKTVYSEEITKETLYGNDPRVIRFCADFVREYVPGRGWVIEIDVVPNYAGKSYIEYAWFNSTYTQKVDIINDSYNLTAFINGTAGCNGTHYITRNIDGANLSQYQLNCADVLISDGLKDYGLDIESTNNKTRNLSLIYADALTGFHFGFNETGNQSYNFVSGLFDSEESKRNRSTGLIGQGFQFDGNTFLYPFNKTGFPYTWATPGIAVFFCAYPYSATDWTTSATGLAYRMTDTGTGHQLYMYSDTTIALEYGGFWSDVKSVPSMAQQWYCFTSTCDGTNCYLYVNTTLLYSGALSLSSHSISLLELGLRSSDGNYKMNGAKIDEFIVFKRNLTSADISFLVSNRLGDNSLYMTSALREYPVNPIVNIVSIDSKANNTNTTDNTPDVLFNVSAEQDTYDCALYVNNTGYGVNSSVLNNTNTVITVNSSLSDGGYYFNITCTGSLTNSSEWFMTISTTTTTTATTTTTITGTTLCSGLYNLTYYGVKQLCVKNLSNDETCLNNTDTYEYDCSKDYFFTLKIPRYSNTVNDVFTTDLPGIVYMIGFTLIVLMILFYIINGVIFS